MPQITVYSAMIGVDGLKHRVEVTLLNPPEHSEGRGRFGAEEHSALEELVRQQVVLHDLIARDTQGEEDERGSNPGSILAGGAMEDQRTFG